MGTMKLVPATVSDYRALAEARLPRQLFDYIDGGASDEVTMDALRLSVSLGGRFAMVMRPPRDGMLTGQQQRMKA